jgi:putative flippase GtrA
MRRLLSLAGFCLVGMGTDVMVVLYYRSILTRMTALAMALSFALTVIPLFIAERGITTRRPLIFLAYAVGAAIGTALGMTIRF